MLPVIFALVIVIGLLYIFLWLSSRRVYSVEYGISFNQNHAAFLGLDWQQAYAAMLADLRPKYVRIAAMWSEAEKAKGRYDFAAVDWMMNQAGERGAKVILAIGQKAPRWPECHVPEWVTDSKKEEVEERLMAYLQQTVDRYRVHPALEIWQVENEPFIKFRFGACQRYRADLVAGEIALVRRLDPNHKIMITDSGELSFWRRAIKAGDIFGTTLYRIVRTPGGRIWTYDWLPAAHYRYKAKIWGQDLDQMFISELQAEPWFTSNDPNNTMVKVQEETMNPDRLLQHLNYAARIGAPRAYLWGVEWWYWMKVQNNDDRYWNIVQERLKMSEVE